MHACVEINTGCSRYHTVLLKAYFIKKLKNKRIFLTNQTLNQTWHLEDVHLLALTRLSPTGQTIYSRPVKTVKATLVYLIQTCLCCEIDFIISTGLII